MILNGVDAILEEVRRDAEYNEGNSVNMQIAEQHYNIGMSHLDQAIAHLSIASIIENDPERET